MKLVLVVTDLEGRGASRVVIDLAMGLSKRENIESHIVCLENRIDCSLPKGIKLHILNLPKKNCLNALFFRKLLASKIDSYILKNIGMPDLVLSNLTHVDKIMKFSHLPVVHVVHNTYSVSDFGGVTDPVKKKKIIESTYTRHPISCVSKGAMESLCRNFFISQPVTYVYNPVDIESIIKNSYQNKDEKYIQSLGNYVVNVGAFVPAKNHEMLVRAWKIADIPHKLVLLGRGETETRVRILVKELDVEDKVVFAGYRSNPFPFVKHAKLFVMSSLYEGFPCALLEAVAIGTPVVSTNCPSGPAELFGENYGHCLSPVNDVEALAANIKAALANPQHYIVPLQDEFRLESVVSQYLKLVDQVRKAKLQ